MSGRSIECTICILMNIIYAVFPKKPNYSRNKFPNVIKIQSGLYGTNK